MKKIVITILLVLGVSLAGDIKPNGIAQGDLYTLLDNLTYSRMYMPLADCGVTANNVASANFSMPTTMSYVNGGYLYSANPSTDITAYTKSTASAVKRTLAVTPVSTYVLHISAAGAYYITSSYGNYMPPKLDGYTPLGGAVVTLTTGNTAGFTLGTTAWNAASQNVTYFDVSAFPNGASKVSLTGL